MPTILFSCFVLAVVGPQLTRAYVYKVLPDGLSSTVDPTFEDGFVCLRVRCEPMPCFYCCINQRRNVFFSSRHIPKFCIHVHGRTGLIKILHCENEYRIVHIWTFMWCGVVCVRRACFSFVSTPTNDCKWSTLE